MSDLADLEAESLRTAIGRAVGEELRSVREARGVSRSEFVQRLPSGVGLRALLSYEHGARQMTVSRLIELAQALDTDPGALVTRGLQRMRLFLERVTLHVDLYALLHHKDAGKGKGSIGLGTEDPQRTDQQAEPDFGVVRRDPLPFRTACVSALPGRAPAVQRDVPEYRDHVHRLRWRRPGPSHAGRKDRNVLIATMLDLARSLVESGVATEDSIAGCAPDELAEFRRVRGVVELPAQYEEFLTVMGRGAGYLLRGTDFFYPAILKVGEWGQEVFDESDMGRLYAPGSLVLGTHQGYIVYWMEPGQPSGPVHRYMDGDESMQTWPSLLEFLVAELADVRQILGK